MCPCLGIDIIYHKGYFLQVYIFLCLMTLVYCYQNLLNVIPCLLKHFFFHLIVSITMQGDFHIFLGVFMNKYKGMLCEMNKYWEWSKGNRTDF